MIDLNNLYINLDVVLSKRATLGNLLTPYEIQTIKSRALKNHWDDSATIAHIYSYLKDNVTDLLDNSDFYDSNIIIESDYNIVKAMQLMEMSQRDAEVLLIDREYRYPSCWVNDISNALKGLQCNIEVRESLIMDAYYLSNWEQNENIPGWTTLAETLESYYDTL